MNRLSLNEFFNMVRDFQLLSLDFDYHIDYMTDGFKPSKLNKLKVELEIYLSMEKEEMESKFTKEEIREAIVNLVERGTDIPVIKIPPPPSHIKIKSQETQAREINEILDKEKLMFPVEFMGIYDLMRHVDQKMKVHGEDTTQLDLIKQKFNNYKLRELNSINSINRVSYELLLNKVITSPIPFAIAILAALNIFEYLLEDHFKTKKKLFTEMASWLKTDSREVKGNYHVLSKVSNENRLRYTSHLYTDEALEFLRELKN